MFLRVLEIVVINDTGGVKQAPHLLKYDSMLGTFKFYLVPGVKRYLKFFVVVVVLLIQSFIGIEARMWILFEWDVGHWLAIAVSMFYSAEKELFEMAERQKSRPCKHDYNSHVV